MSKFTKSTLSLKQFMLRQEVLKLYREIFRSIRQIPEAGSRNDLKQWARADFRANMHHTDELVIKMMLQHGQRSLKELQTNLELSGISTTPSTTKSDHSNCNAPKP